MVLSSVHKEEGAVRRGDDGERGQDGEASGAVERVREEAGGEEEEEEEGVNFYETKRVKKKEEEDMDVAEGRELELNVLWFLIGMTRRSASTFC